MTLIAVNSRQNKTVNRWYSRPSPDWGSLSQCEFLGRNESAERWKQAYDSNFDRLQRYEPEHVLKYYFWPLYRHGDDVNITM